MFADSSKENISIEKRRSIIHLDTYYILYEYTNTAKSKYG